jgi:mitofilin
MKHLLTKIKARANLELQANNAKQLWLAVQNMNEILGSKAEDLSQNSELVNVRANIEKIRESAPDNQFIQTILSSIPDSVVQRGMWSEPDLKDRFEKLKTVCSRVALIDERGGSLFKYFISYVQSYFIFQTRIDKSKLTNLEAFNIDEATLNTFTILDYADYFLEQGNFEYAVRLMQQLKGEPQRLAKDWIREALTLLEIKQATNLLTAYISSVYIGTKFK